MVKEKTSYKEMNIMKIDNSGADIRADIQDIINYCEDVGKKTSDFEKRFLEEYAKYGSRQAIVYLKDIVMSIRGLSHEVLGLSRKIKSSCEIINNSVEELKKENEN